MSLTKEQVAQRVGYIGGSDAAGVLGMSQWKTPLSVWAEKTGQVVPEDISGKLAVKLGIRLEQTVAELFMEETGKKVHRVNETLFHPRYPFIGANIDRRIVGEKAILEVKTTSAFKAKAWAEEEIPAEYILQVMHYMAVTGAARGYIAVLIGNQDFKWKVIERDEKALTELVNREVAFWNDFVVPQIMPSTITSRDKDNLTALFPEAEEGKTVDLDDRASAIVESLEGLVADEKNVGAQIEQQRNTLRAMIGDAEAGLLPSGDKVYWSNVKTMRLDQDALKEAHPDIFEKFRKPTTQRRFLIQTNTQGGNTNGHTNGR